MCLELSNLINQCVTSYKGGASCENCVNHKQCESMVSCKCYDSCIYPLHHAHGCGKTYNCSNMAYNYIVKHLYRFASEIEYAFRDIYNAEYQNWKDTINIVSLGCGPSSELYGIINELHEQNSNLGVSYHGFDTNTIWQDIWEFNVVNCFPYTVEYSTDDMFRFYDNSDEHIDILILNYLLSDIARNMQDEQKVAFLNSLANFIEVRDVQYVIFNDIPLFYGNLNSGYSCMENIVGQFGLNKPRISKIECYRERFGEPNQFQPVYGKKRQIGNLLFTVDEIAKDFQPFEYCNSIQMIIKKTIDK